MPAPISHDYLTLLHELADRLPLPAIRALHLPRHLDQPSRDAEFCALELTDGSIGLTFVWLGDTLPRLRAEAAALPLAGRPALEVATWYAEGDGLRRTLGFAAVNALSQHCFARSGYVPDPAASSIGPLAPTAADHIGMIGLFPPLVERILATGARLTVAELRSQLEQHRERFRVTTDARELATCNKVISTSTILLNDTLDAVLAACRASDYFGIIGPGAQCLPDPLFARGVDTLGGTRIVSRDGFLAALAQGQPWGRHAEKYTIRRDTYPGWRALARSG